MRLLLLFFLCFSLSGFAQYSSKKKSAIVKFETALYAYRHMDLKGAEENLKLALEKDELFVEAHTLLGQVYMETNRFQPAVKHYKRALQIKPNMKPILYMNVAEVELHLAQYDSAKLDLERCKRRFNGIPEPLMEKWNKLMADANFGSEAVKNPVPFEPINMGANINSSEDEYHPSITVDGAMLVFTGKDMVGNTQSGKPVFREDLYFSELSAEGAWGRATNIGPPINARRTNEGSSSISHDGKYLFFTACELPNGYGSCDIYVSERVGGKWQPAENLGKMINTAAWESHPSLSPDGQTLYFASGRSGGKGEHDIWKSTKDEEGNWQAPVNLPINTKWSDMTPYIHADGKTFFFSSNGRPGMGGHDIYYARLDEAGNITEVSNLGYPINSELEEYGMIANPAGELAYYASEMKGGMGGLDLYQFVLPEYARPVITQSISGLVFDANTKSKLNAKVELLDLSSGKVIASTESDARNGSFLVALASERDYAMNVSRNGYLFYSENFSLKGKSAEKTVLKVPLIPIEAGAKVVLKNVFFETASYELLEASKVELDKLAIMLQKNSSLNIEIGGHTDNLGNKSGNYSLSQKRAESVKAYLEQKGIAAERLQSKGYGPDLPIADNSTEEGRAQNRRTEFKVL